MNSLHLKQKILSLFDHPQQFEDIKQLVHEYQYQLNPLYQAYSNLITSHNNVKYLPISLFKSNIVKTQDWNSQKVFESSGTTKSQNTSQHHIKSLDWYETVAINTFEHQYGTLDNRPILALLPNYLERSNSSLVYMVDQFMKKSKHSKNAFYLYNIEELVTAITVLNQNEEPGVLIGVSFALLDLAEQFNLDLENWVVMETGGMKGRRAELTRTELHQIFGGAFNIDTTHSEYGMTELLSQAYSKSNGIFETGPLMHVEIRAIDDPQKVMPLERLGRIFITDLANVDSCSFIATDDLGRMVSENKFTVEGRLDNSDLRGCNLLYHS